MDRDQTNFYIFTISRVKDKEKPWTSMNNSKSKTLFHFTKEAANIYSILENGLNFSYCEKRYDNDFHYALPIYSNMSA